MLHTGLYNYSRHVCIQKVTPLIYANNLMNRYCIVLNYLNVGYVS